MGLFVISFLMLQMDTILDGLGVEEAVKERFKQEKVGVLGCEGKGGCCTRAQ